MLPIEVAEFWPKADSDDVLLRRELRIYNSVSSHWEPLPLMNGDPLPADVQFPADVWQLEGMAGSASFNTTKYRCRRR